MDESKSISNLLKWIGIAALAAVPLLFILNKLRAHQVETAEDDSSNIFAEELSQ